MFMKNISAYLSGIVNNRRKAVNLENIINTDPEKLFILLRDKYNVDLTGVNREEIEFVNTGYSLNIVLAPEVYSKYVGTGEGTNFGGSNINIIKDGEEREEIINHENNHVLAAGFVDKIKITFLDKILDGGQHTISFPAFQQYIIQLFIQSTFFNQLLRTGTHTFLGVIELKFIGYCCMVVIEVSFTVWPAHIMKKQ